MRQKQTKNFYFEAKNKTFIHSTNTKNASISSVEIGDEKQKNTFYPQIKLKNWDNEANLSVRLIEDDRSDYSLETDGSKLIYKNNGVETHFYTLDADNLNENGGYEFEVILKEKPKTNKLYFSIETKYLDFWYQPPLNNEDLYVNFKSIDRSRSTQTELYDINGNILAKMPENVIGSYAVYHKFKHGDYSKLGGDNYKAGKAFHIFRPKIIDSNGAYVWGELHIDVEKKLLTVEIPSDFLNECLYPIIIDPTFGNTTTGATTITTNDYIQGTASQAPENGTIDSISVYIATGANDDGPFALALYKKNSAGSNSHDLITNTTEIINPTPNSWNTYNTITNPSLVGGDDYIISYYAEEMSLRTDFSGGLGRYFTARSYVTDDFPNPWNQAAQAANNWLYTMYATYTVAASTAIVSPLGLSATIPSVTASYAQVNAASVAPLVIDLAPTTTTATYFQIVTASVAPISALITPTTTTAAYSQINTASVQPVVLNITPIGSSSIYLQTETAVVSPLSVLASLTSTTADYIQTNTAIVAPLLLIATPISATANYVQAETASVLPIALLAALVSPTAVYSQVNTASVAPLTLTISPTTTTATGAGAASVAPLALTLTPTAATAAYIQVETASVAPLVVLLSVIDPIATYIQSEIANVAPLQAQLLATQTTATYIQEETAGVAPLQLQLDGVAPTASYIQIETANTLPLETVVTPSLLTANYEAIYSGVVDPLLLQVTPPETIPTYQQLETANANPLVLSLTPTTLTAINATNKIYSIRVAVAKSGMNVNIQKRGLQVGVNTL